MTLRLSLLLGKPPKPGTLLAEVADYLTAGGADVTVRLPHQQTIDPESLRDQDLVVHRGLSEASAPLLTALAERGIPLCTPAGADRLLRDRRQWHAHLVAAGLPLPPAAEHTEWDAVLAAAQGEEIVVKTLSGPGRGAQVLAGTADTLPQEPPFPGPFLVEPRVPAEDTDLKLYVAGDQVRGLLKPSTLTHAHVTSGEPVTPQTEAADLAREVGRVLGTHLYGVDLLRTPDGPVVVDVNAFPGFRGIADAPALVAAHLREHAGQR